MIPKPSTLNSKLDRRSMDRSLTNDEVDELQFQLRDKATAELAIELR